MTPGERRLAHPFCRAHDSTETGKRLIRDGSFGCCWFWNARGRRGYPIMRDVSWPERLHQASRWSRHRERRSNTSAAPGQRRPTDENSSGVTIGRASGGRGLTRKGAVSGGRRRTRPADDRQQVPKQGELFKGAQPPGDQARPPAHQR